MRPEELYERLSDVFADRAIVWLSVEEAKVWGFNAIYYTLAVEPYFAFGLAVFEFVTSNEELTPIAIVLHFKKEDLEKLTLDKITSVANAMGAYIYGSSDDVGLLIPLNEYELEEMFKQRLPKLIEKLFGERIVPVIDGYYFDYLRPTG